MFGLFLLSALTSGIRWAGGERGVVEIVVVLPGKFALQILPIAGGAARGA